MQRNFWNKLNKSILALAPMAGITDSAFRKICRKHGAQVVYSEMASVSALFYKPARTLELLKFNKKERPYVVQLFGKEPTHFAKAAKIVSEIIKPDGIDINFGCPAKKVFGHGSGCALMPQKYLAREIIQAVIENTNLPVSLKIRAGVSSPKTGFSKSQNPVLGITALEFIENVKDLDFKTVMVHCRTYEQGFSGLPDYSIAEKIKKIIPDKIILVNGGINTPTDALQVLKKYKTIDGLSIARGALGKPWIFQEIESLILSTSPLGRGRAMYSPAGEGTNEKQKFSFIKKIAIQHAELLHKNKGRRGLFEIRKHMTWYFKGFPNASDLRKKLVRAKNLEEIKKILK